VASDPYFTNISPNVRNEGPQKIVRGASQRIIRAVPGSQGREQYEDVIDYTKPNDWLSDDIGQVDPSDPGAGVATGFGKWMQTEGSIYDQRSFPVEHVLRAPNPVEERHILAAAAGDSRLMSQAEVKRDPLTRIPDNVAWQDPQAESDRFFGGEKYPRQLDRTLDRMREVDRGPERVDYKKSKAIPIKFIRRPK